MDAQRQVDYLYWSYCFIGAGFWIPWGSLLSAVDYFEDIYPDQDVLRWISVCCIPATLVTILVNGLIPARDRGHFRISLALGLSVLALAFVPMMDFVFMSGGKGTDTTFCFLMLCVMLIGVLEGIEESSFLGLALYLPPKYSQGYASGNGFSAVFTVMIRIVTKAVFTDSTDGLRISAYIFFLMSSFVCAACFFVHRYIIMPHPVFYDESQSEIEAPFIEDAFALSHGEAPHVVESVRRPGRLFGVDWSSLWNSSYLKTLKKMRTTLLLAVLFNVVVYTIYPGIVSDLKCDTLGTWYGVMLVGLFSTADFVGRLTPSDMVSTHHVTVSAAVLVMFALIPINFVAARSFSSPVLISLLFVILGLANGYLTLCVFGMGQKEMEGKKETFVGGNILLLFFILGMSFGSFLSMGWANID